MEAERKAITDDMQQIYADRAEAWTNAQNAWDADDNEWRVAVATANTRLEAVKEAVGKWNARPDDMKALDNDNSIDEYTFTYEVMDTTGAVVSSEELTEISNATLLALWTDLGLDPAGIDTAITDAE